MAVFVPLRTDRPPYKIFGSRPRTSVQIKTQNDQTHQLKRMPIKNPKELFVLLLTNVRNGVQRHTSIYQEMSQLVQDPEIKEAIDARFS